MTGLRFHFKADLNEREVARILTERGDRAAEAGADHLGERADETAPIEDGTLIRSRRVTQADDGHYVVSYDTPYAVRQHEQLDLGHDSGRRAKWLELTTAEERRRLLPILRNEMRI